MKKIISAFLIISILFSFSVVSYAKEGSGDYVFEVDSSLIDMSKTKKTSEIHIRDPYVLVYGQKYFMYGTCAARGLGYGCYVSEDLENWAGPVNVFTAPAGYDGTKCFWAPECHYYNGKFYLFATYFSSATQHRGVSIFRSESPLGPFEEITDSHITPKTWDCIDGTLYVDEENQPWMVFVHEWTSMADEVGDMSAAKLSDDLTHFVSEPISLFRATDAFWATGKITDGPFLYKTKNDKLIMLWSNGSGTGYAVGTVESLNGKIDGKWKHQFLPLYEKDSFMKQDGGHGMIFTDLDGRLIMAIHSPNSGSTEHAVFIELKDTGKSLEIKNEYSGFIGFFYKIANALITIWHGLGSLFDK